MNPKICPENAHKKRSLCRPSAATSSRSELRNDESSLKKLQGDTSEERGNQDWSNKRGKRFSQSRRDENESVVENTLPLQKDLKDGATVKESLSKAGVKKQGEKRPRSSDTKEDVDKTVDNNNTRKDSATRKEVVKQDETKTQGQRRPPNRSKTKRSVDTNNNDKILFQSDLQRDSIGMESGSQDVTKNLRQTGQQSGSEEEAPIAGNRYTTLSEKDDTTRKEDKRPDGSRKQGQRPPQSESVRKKINVSENNLSQSGSAEGKEGQKQDGINKQGQRRPQNRNKAKRRQKNAATRRESERQDETEKQDHGRPQIEREEVNSSVNVLSPKDGATAKEDGQQDGTRKQDQRGLRSRSKAKKSVAALPTEYIEEQDRTRKHEQDLRHLQSEAEAKKGVTESGSDSTMTQEDVATGIEVVKQEKAKGVAVKGTTSVSTLPKKDGATGKGFEEQGKTRKGVKMRPQNRYEANEGVAVKSVENTLSDKDSVTAKKSNDEKEDETRIGDQRRPQNRSEAKKIAVLSGSDSTLPQKGGATGNEGEKQNASRKQNKSSKQNGRNSKGSVDLNSSDSTLFQKDASMKKESARERQFDNRTQDRGRPQSQSKEVKSSHNALPQKDGAKAKEGEKQDEIRKQEQRRPQNRKREKKSVTVNGSVSAFPQKDGATGKEGEKQDGTAKQGESRRQNRRKAKNCVDVNVSESTLFQKDASMRRESERQDDNRTQDRRRPQSESEEVNRSHIVVSQKDGAKAKGEKQDGTRKEDQRRPQNGREAKKSVGVNSSDNIFQRKDGATEKEGKKQDQSSPQNRIEGKETFATSKQDQTRVPSECETKKNVAVNGSDKTSVQNFPQSVTTTKLGQKLEHNNRKDSKSGAVGGSKDAPLQSNKQDVTEKKENRQQKRVKSRLQKRHQKRREDDERGALQGKSNNSSSLKNDIPNLTTESKARIEGRIHTREDRVGEHTTDVLGKGNTSSQKDGGGATGTRDDQTGTRGKERKTNKQKSQSIETLKGLLDRSPEDIVNCLSSEHFSPVEKHKKMKDGVVIMLMRLLAKACDCETDTGQIQLFSTLKSSWFLTRRVGAMLDQLIGVPKSNVQQIQGLNLDTVREIVKLLTEVFSRFPNSCPSALLVKLHKATMTLVLSGKPMDKGVISTLQELTKVRKEEDLASNQQKRRRPPRAAMITNVNSKSSNSFRQLSVIPTHRDIIASQIDDEEPFLRKNKIKGPYYNEEHYLDVQFRLLREDFLRPLRDGIKQVMAMPSHSTDESLQDVRIYENVKILKPVCTSSGVRYSVRFDISKFARVQWENSKRLVFGSLLCLSKDNFRSFVFATVADRNLHNVSKGVIEIRFVSPPDDARPRTGDLCQMVESIAFFEAYRPVLEGLKMISSEAFPLKRYIVKCVKDVRPPAYLTKRDGQQVVFDFSPVMPSENTSVKKMALERSSLEERNDNWDTKVSGSSVTVLDPASWPSAKDLALDDSQFKALQLALSKEFAVIQGPPGTGKTYIGLKIAKVLLHNQEAWSTNGRGGPILVVCYTNHALDQFLEGILEFHGPDGIVRVGGRSQSEKIQECSLSKLKQKRIKNKMTPGNLRQAFGEIKNEMKELSQIIDFHDGMIEELKRTVFHEDELEGHATSMTSKQYDSLVKNSKRGTEEKRPSVIPHWLGLPVQPTGDPYQDGFAQPLVMFPFDGVCWDLEYFSQDQLATVSQDVRSAPGPDGHSGGALQLHGTFDSYIEIPNGPHGPADAERSITLLAFIFPTGRGGPIVSYDIDGLGVQLMHEESDGEMGVLTASFIQRDLTAPAAPLRAPVLTMNEWNFVGASYDDSSGMARLWHNGNEVEAVPIGQSLGLATQFPIRIGALASPGQSFYFRGRISHLHIYAEALTAENIRAVGGIPQQFAQGNYNTSEEQMTVETSEETGESNYPEKGGELQEGEKVQEWTFPGFTFDANVLEDQRILDTDEIIKFDARSLNETSSDVAPRGADGGAQSGGWQFQNAHRIRKKIKEIIRKELNRKDMMSKEEAAEIEDAWDLSEKDRWRLYRRWVYDAQEDCYETIFQFQEMFDNLAEKLLDLRRKEDYEILKEADVVGMTTTGAARYYSLLQHLQPVITIVEEAAEVFEAHTVTSLTPGCQHLILIGDHQQLRPSPTVYDLEINYALDVSLFERMVNNDMEFERLCLQHRMRPEIAKMLDRIYVRPKLQNHDSVLRFEDVKGVERNLFFVDHTEKEGNVPEGKSKSNDHEAKFLTALCRYFIQQGYQQEQITVLTAYSGQLLNLKREMSKNQVFFEGVRVTAVDNFQGEENDIILLSLVRSKRIGFLKSANRVCVALSRAKKGFFIIGNATLLAEKDPDIWAKIIEDMQEQGNLGSHLRLVCQNHPQNVIEASSAKDFENAPKGGCQEPCRLPMPDCEHSCESFCHPIDLGHKEEFACPKPCTKSCDRGHNCPKICSEECGPCRVRVTKVIPGCEHEQDVPCSLDPSEFKCTQIVRKQADPCGHWNDVECSVASSDIVCKEPCGKLECGHSCPGNCNKCQQGRLHLPCNSSCNRTLFCGHICRDLSCVRTCPPCSEPCRFCKRNCGHPCQLVKSDKEQFPHDKSTDVCEDLCERTRCDNQCQKLLSCGHPCVGISGEVCPKLCRVCDKDAVVFSENEQGTMFVELVDCGHVFEVKKLDQWMRNESDDGDGGNQDAKIKYKRCPTCSTLILHSHRYGDIIEYILADFEAVKRRIVLSKVVSNVQVKRILKELNQIKGSEMEEEVKEIYQSIGCNLVTSEQVNMHQNQVTFLKFLDNLIRKYNITNELNKDLYCKINRLTSWVMKRRVCYSEQEIKEFIEELLRTELLAHLEYSIILSPGDQSTVSSIKSALESGKPIDCQRRKEFMADIKKIKQRHELFMGVEATDSESELKNNVVKTKNLAQGPWYKCSQAHVYSAAEVIEDGGSIKCPDCLAAKRGPTQADAKVLSAQVQSKQKTTKASKSAFTQAGAWHWGRTRHNKNRASRK